MQDLGPAQSADDLFSPGAFLVDSNADSHPDDIRARIVLEEEPDAEMWCALFDLAARLGLETSGFTPPLIVDEPGPNHLPIVVRRGRSIRPHLERDGWKGRPAVILEGADAIRDLTLRGDAALERNHKSVPKVAELDLARMFESDGLLTDYDGNHVPDGTRLCIIVPDDLPRAVGIGLFHLVVRLAVESSGIDLPVATVSSNPRSGTIPLRLHLQNGYLARLTTVDHPTNPSLELFGDTNDAAALLERLALRWPLPPCDECDASASEIQDWLRWSLAGWTPEGRTAALMADLSDRAGTADGSTLRLLTPDDAEQRTLARVARRAMGDGMTIVGPGASQTVFKHEWSARWEVDRVIDVLRDDVIPELDRRLPLSLTVTVSEPAPVRRALEERIQRELAAAGFEASRCEIRAIDAFKAGLCWLREYVIPEWKELTGIHRVTLRFRPLETSESEHALDMRIRWLQELFPADEIIAKELDLPVDRITLAEHEGPALYAASAFDEDGTLLSRSEFDPPRDRRPYHALYPDGGSVHYVGGGIHARQNGIEVKERVPTDPERFWDYLQEEVLPLLQETIINATDGEPRRKDQPFFDELFVELTMSETDEPFGIREEMNSAAEALHEDIYFNVLDFVETLGAKTTGERLSAPGGVVPIIHVRPGSAPHGRVELRRRARSVATHDAGDGAVPIGHILSEPPARPTVSSVSVLREQAQLQFRWPSLTPLLRARMQALSELLPPDPRFPALLVSANDGFQVSLGWPPRRNDRRCRPGNVARLGVTVPE